MPPTPEEVYQRAEADNKRTYDTSSDLNHERVVISGMSGLFPQSQNVKEFSDILYNKVNAISDTAERWNFNHPEVGKYSGTITEGLDRFDAQFFKIHYRLANSMDPMSRKLLEQTFQSIYDAGINPLELDGKNIGVYIGLSFSESEKTQFYNKDKYGFGLTGTAKTMFANRISFWLNTRGPSTVIHNSGSSGINVLEKAYLDIKKGVCEAAIVGSANLLLLPHSSIHYSRAITQSKDGKTRSFDENANGCVFSEAVSVLFLQKAKDALRIYADVVHVQTDFLSMQSVGAIPNYGFYRDPAKVATFLNTFYEDTMVKPDQVGYIEAFGSGNPEAEKSELEAIETVFCKNRRDPLLIGSVISNIGYCEAASGLTSVIKVLLGYHKGEIAANLHCDSPRKDIKALQNGIMRVVTKHEPFRSNFAAINSYSITGVNGHVLLQGQYKPKDINRYKSNIPHLVTVSGRQDSAVQTIIDDLKSRPVDPEEIALLHNIHTEKIPGHLGRGFAIISTNAEQKTVTLSEKVSYFDNARPPLWFVYSGMGSQWPEMGTQLMQIPIFAAAIERCHKVLAPDGIDIVHIITSKEKNIFDNILHSFVGIAAIQIGLTDVLRVCGIVPDHIIGHSVGELGCAYADGCLTAEEMILAAKCRGQISLDTPFIRGSMAAVGVGYQQIKDICPSAIEVACHNGPESCTLSGPADAMNIFVAELLSKGIFAKEVPCSNIAYHSRYIAEAGPGILKYLLEVIRKPKPRSARWLSTSIPQDQWKEPLAQTCSAEYLTNNLLNPVLFEETLKLIPPNAVLVEIAPHGLMQTILKRSLPSGCKNISVARRGHDNNILLLLEALGQMYLEGFNPNVKHLYPKVDFPVSTGTPQLSHLINWVHEETWFLPQHEAEDRISSAICNYAITCHEDEYTYLQGNVLNGKTLFPFAGVLMAVWDTFAMSRHEPKRQKSVRFTDVHLFSQPVLHDRRQLRLNVALEKGTGRFEVLEDIAKVASGYITPSSVRTSNEHPQSIEPPIEQSQLATDNEIYTVDSKDIYQHFVERGYSYSGEFRSIHSVNEQLSRALMIWNDNWVTLLDGLIQLNVLRGDHSDVSQPTYIGNIFINAKMKGNLFNERLIETEIDHVNNRIKCSNVVLLERVKFRDMCVSPDYKLQFKHLASSQCETYKPTAMDCRQNIKLQMAQVGKINTMHWVTAPPTGVNQGITVNVHYTGLNYKDVRKAIGIDKYFKDDPLLSYGMDFSGVTESGEHVMGLVERDAASNFICVQPALLWPVPSHWSLEDAVTVPLAYAQAFYCLKVKSNVSPGQRVMVHEGAGALGQAVISVALASGCEVFTTVSVATKKQFLIKLFPELKESNIGNSRDTSFEDMVRNATNGNGCDIIISCVTKELKNATLRCLGFNGNMIDLEQLQNLELFNFPMFYLTKGRSYIAADFSNIFEENTNKYLKILISEGIARGSVRPLSRVVYDMHDASRAFRFLATCQNQGRVLLNLQSRLPPVQPRLICSPLCSHVIFCDAALSTAIQFANRLINRGAKKLIIHTQYQNTYLQRRINTWRQWGIEVETLSGKLENLAKVEDLLIRCTQMGPIEGIFVVATEPKDTDEISVIIQHLDLVSQKLCPDLKYFAVVENSKKCGEKIVVSRASKRLPATMLYVPTLEKFNAQKDSLGAKASLRQFTVDATEQALLSASPVLEAYPNWSQKLTLLQQLATVADIVIAESTESDTLKDLGITDTKCMAVQMLLRDHYNVFVDRENIPYLSLERLRKMDNTVNQLDYCDTKGLAAIISYVDTDELLATTEIIRMSTLAHQVIENDDQFDENGTFLHIIPGIEGHHAKFRDICENLKISALVLQPGLDRSYETIKESAQRYAQMLLEKGLIKDDFYLLGYESGILEAIEVAAILENKGLTGTVFCIGCAPDELQSVLSEHLSEFPTEELLRDAMLRHMFALMNDGETVVLDKEIMGLSNWSMKLDVCVRTLLGRVQHSAQFTRGLIEAALARILRVRKYASSLQPLRSRLVLLRAALDVQKPPLFTLQHYSLQPVVEYQLTASFAHIIQDLRCPAIINRHLSPKVLDLFENINRCESYLIH